MVTERLEADLCSRGLLHNIKRFCVGRRLRPSSSGGDGGGAVVPLITIKRFCVDSVSSKSRNGTSPKRLSQLLSCDGVSKTPSRLKKGLLGSEVTVQWATRRPSRTVFKIS